MRTRRRVSSVSCDGDVHDASAQVAGFTEMGFPLKQPTTANQWTTVVWPEHRGRGIGKWLKAAMLERILTDCSRVREVRTGNLTTNEPMLAINRLDDVDGAAVGADDAGPEPLRHGEAHARFDDR
jgi:GNAT superfamily N-acetyltransferase